MSAESDYEVVVDQEECVSAGKCVASPGGFFVFDSDQIATIDPMARKPDDDTLLRIARACPSGAIRLRRNGVDVEV
ncbi:MAG: ferredoxin [Ilumatobacteraceae bacterium]